MLFKIAIFYVGCLLGSFFYCIAGLWTRGQFSLFARSSCDSCQRVLRWYELFPLVSFLFQKGKCRQCQHALSSAYWLSECLTGCLMLHAYFLHDHFSLQQWVTCLILLLMSFCDLCERWVPDALQLCLLTWLLIQFNWQEQEVILLAFSFILFSCFTLFFYLSRQDWIGGADIKLLLILQLAIPVVQFPLFLLIASSLGLLFWYGGLGWFDFRVRGLPFVPFIAFSFYIVTVYF